jgi:taurine dioxygenase
MAFEIRPLHPYTGSEVTGLDLRRPLDDDTRARLDRELADRGVLVFRDQSLDPPQFAAAARVFGELMPQQLKQFCLPEYPMVGFISNRDTDKPGGQRIVRGEQFHTDHSNFPAPPKATMLHAVSLPSEGGDTQFVNVQAAYEALPDETRRTVDGARSLHAYQSSRSPRKMATLTPEERARMPETVQPLVVTHPGNGRKGLYLNTGRMEGVEGMDGDAAFALIERLMAHATQSRFEYRHEWRKGDMVVWDNRTVMHKANGDVPPEQLRFLYRVMVQGQPLH